MLADSKHITENYILNLFQYVHNVPNRWDNAEGAISVLRIRIRINNSDSFSDP